MLLLIAIRWKLRIGFDSCILRAEPTLVIHFFLLKTAIIRVRFAVSVIDSEKLVRRSISTVLYVWLDIKAFQSGVKCFDKNTFPYSRHILDNRTTNRIKNSAIKLWLLLWFAIKTIASECCAQWLPPIAAVWVTADQSLDVCLDYTITFFWSSTRCEGLWKRPQSRQKMISNTTISGQWLQWLQWLTILADY